MHQERTKTFTKLYNSVKKHHPSIITLNDNAIQKIETDLNRSKVIYNTNTYILAMLSALFFIATYPYLIFKAYSYVIFLQVQLSDILSQRQFIDNHLEVSISAVFLFIGTITYTIMLPNKKFQKSIEPIKFKMMNLDKIGTLDTGRPVFTAFCLIMIYMVLIIPLLYFYSYELVPKIVLDVITTVWLMAPMLLFAAFPTILVVFVMTLIFIRRVRRASEKVPTAIIDGLVSLIYKLDNIDKVKLSDKNLKICLVESIMGVSNLMRRIYQKPTFNDPVSQWSMEQMEKVADNFMLLATWVNYPKSDTLDTLRDRLCIYLNIFLSGHYQELRHEDKDYFKDVVLAEPKKYGVQKFMIFISFAIYLALPIIVIIIFVTLLKFDIQPFIQSLLTILYIIWCALGIISFTENLSHDTKDFLRDVLKSTIGK